PVAAEETLEAVALRGRPAETLEVCSGAPGLFSARTTLDAAGAPLVYDEAWFPADRVRLQLQRRGGRSSADCSLSLTPKDTDETDWRGRKAGGTAGRAARWECPWPVPCSSVPSVSFRVKVPTRCPMQVLPDVRGRFGEYGGRFVPETLMPALEELTEKYLR